MVTTANDLIQNLNYLFIELDVAGNQLSHTYYKCNMESQMQALDKMIDKRLDKLRIIYQHPEWLM